MHVLRKVEENLEKIFRKSMENIRGNLQENFGENRIFFKILN